MCIGWEGVWVKYKFCLEKKQMLRRGVWGGGGVGGDKIYNFRIIMECPHKTLIFQLEQLVKDVSHFTKIDVLSSYSSNKTGKI